jgi:hypothetical protein
MYQYLAVRYFGQVSGVDMNIQKLAAFESLDNEKCTSERAI